MASVFEGSSYFLSLSGSAALRWLTLAYDTALVFVPEKAKDGFAKWRIGSKIHLRQPLKRFLVA